jgi:CP family cyanate transporter-like MFS transporter
VAGLFIAALGGALRGIVPSVFVLYAMTIVLGLGVAIMQPALPAIVRQWAPMRIGFATAVYTNGLLVGEVLPAGLTIPVVLPEVGDRWPLALAVWSLPLLINALAMLWLSPKGTSDGASGKSAKPKWWPDWRDGLVWRLGLIFGSVNSMYFGANTFLPDYLNDLGRGNSISAALTALNFGQLPASFLLLVFADRLDRKAWPYMLMGTLALLSLAGMVFSQNVWSIFSAGVLGFSCGAVLIMALALPPLLRPAADVARTSAGIFTISYAIAVGNAVLGGGLWDLTGIPAFSFAPLAVCAIAVLVLAPTIPFERR